MSVEQHGGLLHALPSRRDYFIAAALQGLLAESLTPYKDVPQLAVDLADEILSIAVSPAPAGSGAPPPRAEPPDAGGCETPATGCSPVDVRGAVHGEAVSGTASDCHESTEENRATQCGDASDGAKDGAPKPESAPALVCEASFPGDADCPGDVTLDAKSKGWFCALHAGVEVVMRREMHRLHGQRNRRPG